MGNFLDWLLEPFRDLLDVWYWITRFIRDPLTNLFGGPALGSIPEFFEETFGGL